MFTISAPRITIRFVALLTAVSLVLSAFPAAFFVANAQEVPAEVPTTETPVEEVTTPVENTEEPADEPADELPEEPVEEVAKAAASIVIDEPVASARLVADKIICDDESVLPNWGSNAENPDITADTAENWVAEHSDDCYFAKGWEFEWAPFGSTGNPGDTLVGPAGAPWTTFSYSTTIPESAFETGIWVREVLQAGYIPYTYNPGKVNTNDVSAEIYCNTDVVNYDNFDYVGGIEPESTYYCVAWNVLAEEPVETCSLTIKSDTSNVVVERDANAFETWVHPNWIQTLPLAKWIWADATTQQPRTGEQYTFENKFGWNPAATVTDVTLKIAADNLYNASLNGGLVADEITPNNINQFSALDTYVLPTNTILDGNNVFSSVVKNVPWNTDFAKTNPGGLYYELVITGEGAADCLVPYEEPEEMYEITGTKWNDANGNGTREEGEEGLAGWTIVAEYGENSISTTTDANGDYTLWVPEGEWSVREVQQEGWYQTSTRQNGDYIYETYSCSFDFSDEPVLYKSLSSELLDIEVVIDGNTCDFGNHYYYETITACKLDENKNPVAGWTMGVTNTESEGEDYYEMTTGEDGCASVDVDPEYGPWIVVEEMQEGWSQLSALATNGDVYTDEEDNVSYCVFFDYEASRAEASELQVVDQDYDYSRTCTFTNDGPDEVEEPEKPRKNGSSGTRTKRPQGQVLGATTQCGLWLNDFMQKATVNDTYQVLKLQVFLNLQGYATPLTGIFDDTTEANVKLFQAKYADTVIKPWFEKGIVPHNRPTGFVYKTTRWQINDIMCPGIEAYPSFEGENLSTNVLINR